MKKLFILLFSSFFFISANTIQEDYTNYSSFSVECKYRQCNAIAKSTGKRCKHCVSSDEDVKCWQHKPKL